MVELQNHHVFACPPPPSSTGILQRLPHRVFDLKTFQISARTGRSVTSPQRDWRVLSKALPASDSSERAIEIAGSVEMQ